MTFGAVTLALRRYRDGMATPPTNPFSRSKPPIESLRALVDRVEVEIVSPDGTVRVSMSRRGGLTVGLPPEVAQHRSEASLAQQAGRAVSAAMMAYAERIVEIADAEFRRRQRERGAEVDERAERLAAQASRIRAVAESPTGHVVAACTGDFPVEVELDIRAGALRELPRELLAAEISAAVRQANRIYRSERAALHRQIYKNGRDRG